MDGFEQYTFLLCKTKDLNTELLKSAMSGPLYEASATVPVGARGKRLDLYCEPAILALKWAMFPEG